MIERGDHRYPLMRHMLKPNFSLIYKCAESKLLLDLTMCFAQNTFLYYTQFP